MRAMATPSLPLVKGTNHPRWFGPFGALLVVCGLVGAFAGYDALRAMSPNKLVGVIGIGGFVLSLVITMVLGKLTKRDLLVDADGIEVTGRGKSMRIRWSEPHDLYYRAIASGAMPSVEKVSVRTGDGRRIDVDNVDIPGNPNAKVPTVVEHYSTAANWPRIEARLAAGEDVSFGALRMSRERIQAGVISHATDNTICLQIDKGRIQIGSKGKWFASKVWIRDVANYPCLLRAVGQVAQARPPG